MRYVRQRHITGCGVASTAMLAGTNYDKALKAVRPDRKPGGCACSSLKDMIKGLEKLGYKPRLSYKNVRLSAVKENAMIIVRNPGRGHAGLHVVVWDAENRRILDPWDRPSKFTIDEAYVKKYHEYRIFLA